MCVFPPVRHEELLEAIAVQVAGVGAHARLGPPHPVHGAAEGEGSLLESPVAAVPPEEVGLAIVGGVEVEPAVVVEVVDKGA